MTRNPSKSPSYSRTPRFRLIFGLIFLAVLIHLARQTYTRVMHARVQERRMAHGKKANTPIKLAFIYPEKFKDGFLAGAKLAVNLANAAAQTNAHYRRIEWKYFEEDKDSILRVADQISQDPSIFGTVGFYYSQNAIDAISTLEDAHVLTIISSASSSRMMARKMNHIFTTAITTEKIGNHVLPSIRQILPQERLQHPLPIQLAIVRTPSIYSQDICLSLYADIARNNAKMQFIPVQKQYPQHSLSALLDREKISHYQFEVIQSEMERIISTNAPATKTKEALVADWISSRTITVHVVMDITFAADKSQSFAVISELAERKPDVIFFATEPNAMPLITQLRRVNTEIPILVPLQFDDPTHLAPFGEHLTNFYMMASFDSDIQRKEFATLARNAERIYPGTYKNFTPDTIESEAYQAVELLIQAIRLHPDYYPEFIAPALKNSYSQEWNILGQTLKITPKGTFENNLPIFLKTYENGRLVEIPQREEK